MMVVKVGRVFRWGTSFNNKKRLLLAVTLFIVSILQSGCIDFKVEDKIVFRPDGSGTATFTIAVAVNEDSSSGYPIQDFKKNTADAAKSVGGTSRVWEDGTWTYGEVTFSFDTPADLVMKLKKLGADGGLGVRHLSFVETGEHSSRKQYKYDAEIGVEFVGENAILAPFFKGWTHRVSLPGSITETNGSKKGSFVEWEISADEVVEVTATSTAHNVPELFAVAYNNPVMFAVGLILIGIAGVAVAVVARRARAGKGKS